MQCILFMDLDDTIFQTRRKCAVQDGLTVGALSKDGTPLSFLQPKQQFFFSNMLSNALVIPTTARNRDAFSRVQLAFSHGAILNYGGLILLPSGAVDSGWYNIMQPQCARFNPTLHGVLELANATIAQLGLDCRARIVSDDGLDFYVVVKNYNGQQQQLESVASAFAKNIDLKILRVHRNDNNLAVLPAFLDKAAAVTYCLDNLYHVKRQETLLIGMGDSLSDKPCMQLCVYMIMPAQSQLGESCS